jgi:hypothetical protein
MKAKKAVKRLARVETLLDGILDQFPGSKDGVRKLLDSAKGSVTRAKEEIHVQTASAAEKKPVPAKDLPGRRRISAAGRKRISAAAKKRWAVAKRKGVHAVTGQRLSRTA